MKGRKTWERGYAAGLIDGEGCIQIRKIKNLNKKRNAEYSLQVSISLVDGEPIDFMSGAFGGKAYFISKTYGGPNRLPQYRWELMREPAKKFLKQIIPFLKIKKQQAELGIRFQDQRITQDHKNGRFLPFSKEYLDRCDLLYQEMRRLKTVHNSSAAVTTKRVEPILSVSDSLNLQE